MPEHETPVVMVVEDECALADLYTTWLAETYDVRTAYGGREALENLDESVDVVLLDRRMPEIDGDEVLAEVRRRGLDCRVAMVTAVDPGLDIVEMGFDDYLVKPVTADDLHKTVDRLLDQSAYDERLHEYCVLARKLATLEAEMSDRALSESEEYAQLERDVAAARERLDAAEDEMDDLNFRVAFRDIDGTHDAEPGEMSDGMSTAAHD